MPIQANVLTPAKAMLIPGKKSTTNVSTAQEPLQSIVLCASTRFAKGVAIHANALAAANAMLIPGKESTKRSFLCDDIIALFCLTFFNMTLPHFTVQV